MVVPHMSKEELKAVLQNEVISVTFVKKDSTLRVMKCTLRSDIVPQIESTNTTPKKQNDNVFPVWDIEANGWRSFTYDSITSVLRA